MYYPYMNKKISGMWYMDDQMMKLIANGDRGGRSVRMGNGQAKLAYSARESQV